MKCSKIFLQAFGYRIFMMLVAAVILAFLIQDGSLTLETFLNSFCRWDASHYLNIAKNGYAGAVEACDVCRDALIEKGVSPNVMTDGQHLFLVFFPLFPWLVKLFGTVFGDLRIAALLISTLAYSFGSTYLYRLVKIDYDEEIAQNALILLSVFPFSFFFGTIMSESIFLLVSAASLYHIRKHEWGKAILFGILCSLCRMHGILVIVPAAIEILCLYEPWKLIRTQDYIKLKEMICREFSLLSMLIGVGVYLMINWKVDGYPFSFMVYQKSHWNNGLEWIGNTLKYVFINAFSDAYSVQMRSILWIPQALLFVFAILVIGMGIKKIRPAYTAYAVIYILLTYSSAWLISAGRYMCCCIPLFIALAVIGKKHKWIVSSLSVIFSVLMVLFFNGYMNGLSIM